MPACFCRINQLPLTLPAAPWMFLPLVEKGMNDFGPNRVELQVRDAVEILLAAKETQTSQNVKGAAEEGDAVTVTEGLEQKP